MSQKKRRKGKYKSSPSWDDFATVSDHHSSARLETTQRDEQQQQDHRLILTLQRQQTEADVSQATSNRAIVRLTRWLVGVAFISGIISVFQFWVAKESADAARDASRIAKETLTAMQQGQALQERPWIKVSHKIVKPLTFDIGGRASGKNVALMTVESTIENVGKSVALNVKSWQDLVPIEPDFSLAAAKRRQAEWCESNRFQKGDLTGVLAFPNDPVVQEHIVGPTMESIEENIKAPGNIVPGKVGFVLVGCVVYKAAFEPSTLPAHKTSFVYFLGTKNQDGTMSSFVDPKGVASQLRLIGIPLGQTAD